MDLSGYTDWLEQKQPVLQAKICENGKNHLIDNAYIGTSSLEVSLAIFQTP